MSKVAIMTDSNSGITQEEAKVLGLRVLPMPFIINGEEFFEGVGLTNDMFYEKQIADADITTSQPSPASVTDMWDELLKEYDEVVHIPMASGLSESCNTAKMLAEDYDGKVHVADNKRILITQRRSVFDAVELAKKGLSGAQIKKYLEEDSSNSGIYFMVNTMKYLKKGGRVTPAAALIGTVLGIKPVLTFQGGKIDRHAKPRGTAQAKKAIIDAVKADLEKRGLSSPDKVWLDMTYSYDLDAHLEFEKEVKAAFPGYEVSYTALSLSIATHIGPGVIALGYTKKMD